MSENLRSIELDDRERATLADAIDAYRSVRTGNQDWHRVRYAERFAPAELDSLQRALLGTTPAEREVPATLLLGARVEVEVDPGAWLELIEAMVEQADGRLGGDPGDVVCSFPGDSRAYAPGDYVRVRDHA